MENKNAKAIMEVSINECEDSYLCNLPSNVMKLAMQ